MAPLATCTIPGEPKSKQRPRFNGRHTYTPTKTQTAEQHIALQFQQQNPQHKPHPNKQYTLTANFYAATKRRRDLDNMLKLVADALNGIAWIDDHQITEMTGRKLQAKTKQQARTEITITETKTDR